MNTVMQINLTPDQIIDAIKKLDEIEQQDFVEDLLTAISPDYLESIKEARQDYCQGRVYSHSDAFD